MVSDAAEEVRRLRRTIIRIFTGLVVVVVLGAAGYLAWKVFDPNSATTQRKGREIAACISAQIDAEERGGPPVDRSKCS